MTLIAATRCETGFLICADTQETVGDEYRQPVRKLVELSFGKQRETCVYAGAGHGVLIDAFEIRLGRELRQQVPASLSEFVHVSEELLADFYRVDVATCQDESKDFSLLLAASIPSTAEFGVWEATHTRLRPVTDWTLFGMDYPLYRDMFRRLCRPNQTIGQAMLATLYVFSVAGDTSNFVGPDADLYFVDGRGAWREPRHHVQSMQTRLREYERKVNEVFLACSDTSLSTEQLRARLREFQDVVLSLHQAQIHAVAEDMFSHGVDMVNDPYARIPLGSVISVGPGIHVWEPEELEEPRPGFVPKPKRIPPSEPQEGNGD